MRAVLSALALAAATPAFAEQTVDYAARADDLSALSRIFGELHAIRRMCEPDREADIWRDRMRMLVELEMPAQSLRERMVSAFNDGFRGAEGAFPYCDRDARDHAARIAADGDDITRRLVEPLYEAASREEGDVTVYRGGDAR